MVTKLHTSKVFFMNMRAACLLLLLTNGPCNFLASCLITEQRPFSTRLSLLLALCKGGQGLAMKYAPHFVCAIAFPCCPPLDPLPSPFPTTCPTHTCGHHTFYDECAGSNKLSQKIYMRALGWLIQLGRSLKRNVAHRLTSLGSNKGSVGRVAVATKSCLQKMKE